jgi:hypothetical protein
MRGTRVTLLAAGLWVGLVSAQAPSPGQQPPPAAREQKPTADELRARIKDSREWIARVRERIKQLSQESGVPADKSKAFDIVIRTNPDTATEDDKKRARDAYRIWEELVSLTTQETALRVLEQQLENTDDILDEIEETKGQPDRTARAYTPMAEPWADVTPELGAMVIIEWLREDKGPLSLSQIGLLKDFIRMYSEAFGLPTDSTALALQASAAAAFPSEDPAQAQRGRRATVLHGIVTLFESHVGPGFGDAAMPSPPPAGPGLDWGTVQPGTAHRRSVAISNGCASVKVVAITHAVPHLSAPASVRVPPGGSTVELSLNVPADGEGVIEGTITLTYAGDDTCKPRTTSFPITARISG